MPIDHEGVALIQRAAAFSARAHHGQFRKDGVTPYASHPARVSQLLAAAFGITDAELLAAALLHDTIEDTTTDRDDLEEHFGPRVASLVVALTKDSRLSETEREMLYDETLRKAEPAAKLIKLCDQIDNFGDLDPSMDPAFKARAAEKCRRAIEIAREDASFERGPLKDAVLFLEAMLNG